MGFLGRILNAFRVDKLSAWMKPFLYLYGYFFGIPLYVYFYWVHKTSQIHFMYEGEARNEFPRILCNWHEAALLHFCVYIRQEQSVWMAHPSWYMMPILMVLKFSGVKQLCMGSTGFGGREAADQVVEFLKKGYSTAMAPDGPSGPVHVAKKGILHLSLQSQVPIVPVQFRCARFFRLPSWDRKIVPLPWNRIYVVLGGPRIPQSQDTLDQDLEVLSQDLG